MMRHFWLLFFFLFPGILLSAQEPLQWRAEFNGSMNILYDKGVPFYVATGRNFTRLKYNGWAAWQGGIAVEGGNDKTRLGLGVQIGYRGLAVKITHGYDIYSPGGNLNSRATDVYFKGHYQTFGIPFSIYRKLFSRNRLEAGIYSSVSWNTVTYREFFQDESYRYVTDTRFRWMSATAGPAISFRSKLATYQLRPQAELVFTQTQPVYFPLGFLCTVAVSLPIAGKTPE